MIDIRCSDPAFLVCIKPAGVLSTDEPGGLPELLRETLGDEKACVRTVHRLDRVVSGLMVLARTPEAASELSRQIRAREFDKSYLAVAHEKTGELLKAARQSFITVYRLRSLYVPVSQYYLPADADCADSFLHLGMPQIKVGSTMMIRE